MRIFRSIKELNNCSECVCALGNFDGIHKGHQKLIESAVSIAKSKALRSAVFTFTDHPLNVMSGHTITKNILSFDDKAKILEDMGVDYLFSFDFEDYRTMSPEDFAKNLLAEGLNIKHAVCGFNYSFGYKAMGHNEDLIEFGKKYGFETTVIEPVQIDGLTVSSTLIRACIEKGDLESYLNYTGRLYAIYGKVIEGEHNGRKMGFPTVNLNLDASMALPANGVYTTKTIIDEKVYASVTNVGNKPTIGDFDKNAETHIFDFQENIYGKPLMVQFIKMQRNEQKFENMDALAVQIEKDCMEAKKYHEIH